MMSIRLNVYTLNLYHCYMSRPMTKYVNMPLLSGFICVHSLCEDQLDLYRLVAFLCY